MLISGSQVQDALISGVPVHHICLEYASVEDFSVSGTLTLGRTSLMTRDSQGKVWNQITAAGIVSGHNIMDAEFPSTMKTETGFCHMLYSTDLEWDKENS